MIENSGMQRPFERATGFMRPRPQHMGATPFEAWQHDPQVAARCQLHEALEAKARDGNVRDRAAEPGFTRPTNLDADLHRTAVGRSYPADEIDLPFGAHDRCYPSFTAFIGHRGKQRVKLAAL